MAIDGKFYWKWNAVPNVVPSLSKTLNVNQWFETTAASHNVRHETHLPETVETVTSKMLKEDRSNKTFPLGNKANSVVPNGNNNNNNINSLNMLDSSDDEDEFEWKMSDEEYDLYYHDDLFVEYNSNPTLKRVHNPDLAPIFFKFTTRYKVKQLSAC